MAIQIKKPEDVRRLLARLINDVLKARTIDESIFSEGKLRAVTYASNILLRSFEIGELDQRLSKIEERILKK